jgi:hypothetical protein
MSSILRGPQQSCEDSVCIECGKYLEMKQYDNYKQCKKTCMVDKQPQIAACCTRLCTFDPRSKAQQSCLDACQNLDYGGR